MAVFGAAGLALTGSPGNGMGRCKRKIASCDSQETNWIAVLRSRAGPESGIRDYRFGIRAGALDRNAVFGMFLWDGGAPRLHFREVETTTAATLLNLSGIIASAPF